MLRASMLLSAALLVLDTSAAAQVATDTPVVRRAPRSFTFYGENDVLYFGGKDVTDQHYTNGVQASWTTMAWPRFLRIPDSRWWPGKDCEPRHLGDDPNACGFYTVGLGQTMYTPRNLERPDTQRFDRPFAGWMFVSASLHSLRERHRLGVDLQAGVIGASAGAQHTQSMAHWWWAPGAVLPQGWRNQLRNQVGANIGLSYSYTMTVGNDLGLAAELSPRAVVQTGTVMTDARAGVRVRAGWNMSPEFQMTRIPVTLALDSTRVQLPWVAAVVELEGRTVAHNALVTGGYADADVWRESLKLEPYGRDLTWGVSAGWRAISLSHQWVRRSAEFSVRNQAAGTDQTDHRFGITTFTISRGM